MIKRVKRIEFVILCRNRADYLRLALKSIMSDNLEQVSLKISDNSDNSDVRELVRKEFRCIDYIKRNPTLNALDHFRSVIEEASAEYIVMFHDDDEVIPGYIDALCGALDNNAKAAAAGCNAYITRKLIRTTNTFMPETAERCKIIRSANELAVSYLRAFTGYHAPFPSYMYRTALLKGKLLVAEDGGKHSDVSFLMKIVEDGELIWLTKPFIYYRVHGANASSTESEQDRLSVLDYIAINSSAKISSMDIIEYRAAYKLRALIGSYRLCGLQVFLDIEKWMMALQLIYLIPLLLICRPISLLKRL